jgi:predicted nucleic acid-binding protein
MHALVLDASAACSLCFEDEAGPAADQLLDQLQTGEIWVPALFAWEVANVLLMAERRGRLSHADRVEFLHLLESLQLQVDPPSTAVIWHDVINLAQQCGLTAYDAAYLELAMRLGLPIASGDQQTRQAAGRLGVALLPG